MTTDRDGGFLHDPKAWRVRQAFFMGDTAH